MDAAFLWDRRTDSHAEYNAVPLTFSSIPHVTYLWQQMSSCAKLNSRMRGKDTQWNITVSFNFDSNHPLCVDQMTLLNSCTRVLCKAYFVPSSNCFCTYCSQSTQDCKVKRLIYLLGFCQCSVHTWKHIIIPSKSTQTTSLIIIIIIIIIMEVCYIPWKCQWHWL